MEELGEILAFVLFIAVLWIVLDTEILNAVKEWVLNARNAPQSSATKWMYQRI